MVGGKCDCPLKSNWNNNKCNANSLNCASKKYNADGNCHSCKWGYHHKKDRGLKYCTSIPWWWWLLFALAALVALLLLVALIYGLVLCCKKFCCKKKKAKQMPYQELVEVHAPRPQPVYVRPEVVVEAPRPPVVVHDHYVSNVTRGEPIITYGKKTVSEVRGDDHHAERRHVETRQYSPDRKQDHTVTYSNHCDWAKESRVRYTDDHVHNLHSNTNMHSHGYVAHDSHRVVDGHVSRRVTGDSSRSKHFTDNQNAYNPYS